MIYIQLEILHHNKKIRYINMMIIEYNMKII